LKIIKLSLCAYLVFNIHYSLAIENKNALLLQMMKYYEKQDWNHFLAKAFSYRLQIVYKVKRNENIKAEELSPLFLELSTYMRLCQDQISIKLINALDELLKKIDSPLFKDDIVSLRRIYEKQFPESKKELQIELKKKKIKKLNPNLWQIPSTQNSDINKLEKVSEQMMLNISNRCGEKAK
jgi:hypothetical protein